MSKHLQFCWALHEELILFSNAHLKVLSSMEVQRFTQHHRVAFAPL